MECGKRPFERGIVEGEALRLGTVCAVVGFGYAAMASRHNMKARRSIPRTLSSGVSRLHKQGPGTINGMGSSSHRSTGSGKYNLNLAILAFIRLG